MLQKYPGDCAVFDIFYFTFFIHVVPVRAKKDHSAGSNQGVELTQKIYQSGILTKG